MVKILREADASSVAEVARKHKVSAQTIYIWRKKFGALDPADAKRLHCRQAKNAKLKRMVALPELVSISPLGPTAAYTGPSYVPT